MPLYGMPHSSCGGTGGIQKAGDTENVKTAGCPAFPGFRSRSGIQKAEHKTDSCRNFPPEDGGQAFLLHTL